MGRRSRPLDPDAPWAPYVQGLRELRQAEGLTIRELADRSRCSATTVSRAMSGHDEPRWDVVAAVLAACGVTDEDDIARWREALDHTRRTADAATAPSTWDVTDPAALDRIHVPAEFTIGLRNMREQAGLSIRQVVAQSDGRLSLSTTADLLAGRGRPTRRTVEEYLLACQRTIPVDVAGWLRTWDRIVLADSDVQAGTTNNERTLAADPPSTSTSPMPARHLGWRLTSGGSSAAPDVRDLARLGRLAQMYDTAELPLQLSLRRGLHEIACQVVFERVTTRLERARGHYDCSSGMKYMRSECLDRFHDDVEAVVNDALRRATTPIDRLDAWMAKWVPAATVDGYRRRRGARGAMQRPRLPQWLRHELGDDPWKVQLALQILTWVGDVDTRYTALWPIDSWSELRGAVTGDHQASDPRTVGREIELVLTAMRRRPKWYANYVDRPLGHKPIALAPSVRTEDGQMTEPSPLSLVETAERDDNTLRELATHCLDAIREGLALPAADPTAVVAEAIRQAFGAMPIDLARLPYRDTDRDIDDILADPAAAEAIAEVALGIVRPSCEESPECH